MTKTLTEQWREGKLPAGFYYLETNDGLVIIDHTIYVVGEKIYRWELSSVDYVKEALAPVPSYDEYCNLVFQANKPKNPLSDVMMCYDTEREKKVVERLQEQLDEANEIIRYYDIKEPKYVVDGIIMGKDPAHIYCVKWGVK